MWTGLRHLLTRTKREGPFGRFGVQPAPKPAFVLENRTSGLWLAGAVAFALVALVAGLIVLRLSERGVLFARPVAPPAATARPTANEPPPAFAAARPEFRPSLGTFGKFQQKLRFNPPIDPVDTRTFEADGHIVVIADMETPALGAVCLDEAKSLWACGLQARAALFNRIRKGVLECTPKSIPGASGESLALGWQCEHNGEDIALWMIRSGWARPSSGSPLGYAAAADAARQERRGLWLGGWKLVERAAQPAP